MFYPSSELSALGCCCAALLLWGTWANTFKLAHSDFRIYYIDFSAGLVMASLIIVATLGQFPRIDWNEPNMYIAFSAGPLFNLGPSTRSPCHLFM